MGQRTRTTGVTNAAVQISQNTPAGRTPNLLSVQVVNPVGVPVTVDILDGNTATVVDTVVCGPFGQSCKKWALTQRLGNLSFTAGNAIYAKTRTAVAGGVEVLCEAGRI